MDSELKRYTESNRAAWNEVMPFHQRSARQKWDTAFSQPGFVALDQIELQALQQVGIQGQAIAHLCCNNGVELLSLKNLGAGRCVGFDISDEAIAEAAERASLSQIDCQFVRSDVYEIGSQYANQFDIVYITIGCLGWMPDLMAFFEKAAQLLKPEGRVFIHEAHPFAEMLPFGKEPGVDYLQIKWPYFKVEPYIEQGGLDYVGGAEYSSTTTQYWFVHTLSDIVTSMLSNRIAIERFSEYENAVSPHQLPIEEAKAGVPLSYILIGKKSK